jgi:hypothetical protein
MIKIRVHIDGENDFTDNVFMDERVYKEITLPSVPCVGSFLMLDKNMLHDKVKSSLDIAENYLGWFYGRTYSKIEKNLNYKLTIEDLENLSFDDAIVVKKVCYCEGENYVSVEIGI